MKGAGTVGIVKKAALRFFHRLANGVKIVAGGDDGEQHDEGATERADDDK
jgi:hypothetical protein